MSHETPCAVQTLGCGSDKWVANVAKLQSDRKEAAKKCKLLSEELAVNLGRQLAGSADEQTSTEVFVR